MEIIDKRNLDLDMFEIVSEGEEGKIYYDGDVAYKLFKTKNLKILNNKENKLDILNEIDIDNVVKPEFKIYDNNRLCGYGMKYVESNDLCMMIEFSKMYDDCSYMDILYIQMEYISNLLKEIHSNKYKLVVGDVNSTNIVFNKDFIPYFIDIDSWQVENYSNDGYAYFYSEYIFNRNINALQLNEDTDRLCLMLLSLIMPFRNKCLDDISIDEFDKKCEYVEGLSVLHDYFVKLKEEKEKIPDVPYVGDVLKKSLFK